MSKEKVATEKLVDIKQQLEKDRIQKDILADKAKPKCQICGKYTDKKTSPQCFGHGGPGGGGSGGGDSGEQAGKDDAAILAKSTSQFEKESQEETISAIDSRLALIPQVELNDIKFNPEVISELLSRRLLFIDNDRERGILSFKLLCDPDILSSDYKNELKKFVNALLNELDQFKKDHRLSADCYTITKDRNGNILSLRIALPTYALYEAFIQRLASRHLLPVQNIQQHINGKVVYPEGQNHFNPTPLSTRPAPANKKSSGDEEADKSDKSQKRKSSIVRPKSPLDGPRPKGWD